MSLFSILTPGLVQLEEIVSQGRYILRIDLEDWDGEKRFAKYRNFNIGNTDEKYKLTASVYSGDAGMTLKKSFVQIRWMDG